jgi:ubiquitin-conjugating enzyme E2 G1
VRQNTDYIELQKNPVDGFSAGLVDDENILEWQIVIMG